MSAQKLTKAALAQQVADQAEQIAALEAERDALQIQNAASSSNVRSLNNQVLNLSGHLADVSREIDLITQVIETETEVSSAVTTVLAEQVEALFGRLQFAHNVIVSAITYRGGDPEIQRNLLLAAAEELGPFVEDAVNLECYDNGDRIVATAFAEVIGSDVVSVADAGLAEGKSEDEIVQDIIQVLRSRDESPCGCGGDCGGN